MKEIKVGEVWRVRFPKEENESEFMVRPAVVLGVDTYDVFSVKVTKREPRDNDKYDVPIIYWKDAKLRYKSTAKVRYTRFLDKKQFISKYGDLYPDDFNNISNTYNEYIND
jgi:hypothetical protein